MVPGAASFMRPCGQPPGWNAAVPLGVPRPVGPSQPVPALQIGAPQPPLRPDVTSNRLPAFWYGYEAGKSAAPGVPARAYTDAMIGADALVPPNTAQPPLWTVSNQAP